LSVAGFEAASSGSGLFRHGVGDVDEGIGYNPDGVFTMHLIQIALWDDEAMRGEPAIQSRS
jgi:hypothetical protein